MYDRPGSRPKPRFRPQLERSEPRLLLSAGGLAGHHDAHPVAHVAEAQAEHTHALTDRAGSVEARGKASPLGNKEELFQAFEDGATFGFRSFNTKTATNPPGGTNLTATIGRSNTYDFFVLTVTPKPLTSTTEVLDLNFQYNTELLQINGRNELNFGPLGLPPKSPESPKLPKPPDERIPLTKRVKITGAYIYFTLNGTAINDTATFGDVFTLKQDPLDKARTDLFTGQPFDAFPRFWVLNGTNNNGQGITVNRTGFSLLKVNSAVNGMHILIEVQKV
jgi:hypothetical protein